MFICDARDYLGFGSRASGRAMCRVGEERVGEPESKRFGVSVSEYVSQDLVSVEWWRSIPSGCL